MAYEKEIAGLINKALSDGRLTIVIAPHEMLDNLAAGNELLKNGNLFTAKAVLGGWLLSKSQMSVKFPSLPEPELDTFGGPAPIALVKPENELRKLALEMATKFPVIDLSDDAVVSRAKAFYFFLKGGAE